MKIIRSISIEIIRTYGLGLALLIAGAIPYLNLLYSGHGGVGWFILPAALPIGLFAAIVRIAITKGTEKNLRLVTDVICLPAYLLIAYPLSVMAAKSIPWTFGLPVTTWEIYRLAAMPFTLPWMF